MPTEQTRIDIFAEIEAERQYQTNKWGTDADTNVNTPMDFVGYIAHYSTRWLTGGFRPYSRSALENNQGRGHRGERRRSHRQVAVQGSRAS
jgi:hypothetical protein